MQTEYPNGSSGGPSKTNLVVITVLIVLLLVSSSFLFLLYQQYDNESRQITSLKQTVSSLEKQEAENLQQLLTANGTYPGAAFFGNLSSSNNINPVKIYSYANASIVTIQGTQIISGVPTVVLGSGFVVVYSNKDYIITNDHVVAGDSDLSVTFSDGNGYAASVVGADPYSDLAAVSTNASQSEFHPLAVVPSTNLTVGQSVIAIGNPFGLSGSMTNGIVSQLGRTIQDETAGNFSIADVIQISTPINPGNSGGPLLNALGQVVGITTAIVSGSQGVGFAIPSDTILREIPYLITNGSYDLHPYLGIQEEAMSYDLAKAMGTNVTYGVLVDTVLQNGPSANKLEGGSRTVEVDGAMYTVGGDIIISVNGTRVDSIDALSSWLEQNALPGNVVQFGVVRNGTRIVVNVTLGTRPPIS